MKKKNGFDKPTGLEKDIEKTFTNVVSSIPSTPMKVKKVLTNVKEIERKLKAKRKAGARRLIKR